MLLLGLHGCHPVKPEPHLEFEDISDSCDFEYPPAIACGPDGHVVLAWTDTRSGPENIWMVEKDRGGHWGQQYNLSQTEADSRFISLCYDSSGALHAAWQQLVAPGNWVLFYTQRQVGGQWAPAETIRFGLAGSPHIGADKQGRVHIEFVNGGYPGDRICYLCRNTDGTWDPIRVLHDAYSANWGGLSVWPDGTVFVVWEDDTTSGEQIYCTIRQPTGEWSEPVDLYPSYPYCGMPVVSTMQGKAYVGFSTKATVVLSFNPDSGWRKTDSVSTRLDVDLALAADASGRPLLAGFRNYQLQLLRLDSTWVQIAATESTALAWGLPCIAIDQGYVAHLCWQSQTEVFYATTDTRTK
jgi:hypothetical protein